MAKQPQNVTAFPTSRRERRRLLRRSSDVRLRIVSVLRALTGWGVAVAVLAFLAVNFRLFTPTSIRRVASYARAGMTAAQGDLHAIPYASGGVSDAIVFDGGLVLADSDTIYVSKPGGLNQLTLQLSYAHIALDASENFILAYDRGARGLTVANALTTLVQTELPNDILTASISNQGDYVVVSGESGYKSAVTVYSPEGKQTYKWSSSEYYVQSAALSPSGKRMAALGFHMNGAMLESKLLFFDLGSEKIANEVSLGSALGLETRFLSDSTVGAVCDTGAFVVSRSGKILAQQSYAADDLLSFAWSGQNLALATRSYMRSARSELHVLDGDGHAPAPLYLSQELQSLSCAAGQVAVLTPTGLHLYNDALHPLWSDIAAAGGRRVLLGNDGTAFVLMSKNARLFTKNTVEGSDNDISIPTQPAVSAGNAAAAADAK